MVQCRKIPTVVIVDQVRWLRLRALALRDLATFRSVRELPRGHDFIEWTASGQSQQTTGDPQLLLGCGSFIFEAN